MCRDLLETGDPAVSREFSLLFAVVCRHSYWFIVCQFRKYFMMASLLSSTRFFDGEWRRYKHDSTAVETPMEFSVYVPPGPGPFPAIMWLSGLTCTDKNFMEKSGCQRLGAKFGVAFIAPDTSPRGAGAPGEDDSWDFGTGAGFYLNATTDGFKKHYRMYDYITKELPEVVKKTCPEISGKWSISGHSMGGHGAITLFMKNRDKYESVSAFAPIANPTNCPWGVKAFTGYLGTDRSTWAAHDSSVLIASASGPPVTIKVTQGTADNFLKEQLKPEALTEAAGQSGGAVAVDLHMAEGYDHSYAFVASFLEDHVAFHAKALGCKPVAQ
eukprot:TRINITY_DN61979_c0_g1_i1.p1 TRINITY_DN61979_c0_g1~~TRINITY_DN61979_c0_g1_i1.p1  ORF type:complete len:327 (+),score=38.39 TRINITY_DN61979_c0_g1_i1:75-1055(+)